MKTAITALALAVLASHADAQSAPKNGRFKDCKSCPEMAVIPPGRVLVGMARGQEDRAGIPAANQNRAEPVTEVRIRHPFAIGRFEVTRAEYEGFVAETRYQAPSFEGCWEGYGRGAATSVDERREIGRPSKLKQLSWTNPGFPQTPRDPVVCVSYQDIEAYLKWLSAKTKRAYRLPSEAEWNYVANDGKLSLWPWGDDAAAACKYGNFSDLTRAMAQNLDLAPDNVFQCYDGHVHTAPVGRYPANKFGVHDLFGNVMEVTQDCFLENLEKLPLDGAPQLAGDCKLRTSKGGSWDIFPYATPAGYRGRFDTGRSERYTFNGFRVAVTLPVKD